MSKKIRQHRMYWLAIAYIVVQTIATFMIGTMTANAADYSLIDKIPKNQICYTPDYEPEHMQCFEKAVGDCPFFEMVEPNGKPCAPPEGFMCNADATYCEPKLRPEYPETAYEPKEPYYAIPDPCQNGTNGCPGHENIPQRTNTQVAPQSPPNELKQGGTTYFVEPINSIPVESDTLAIVSDKNEANAAIDKYIDDRESAQTAEVKNTERGVEKFVKTYLEFMIAMLGVVLWIALLLYIRLKHPGMITEALNLVPKKIIEFAERTKRR